MYSLKKRRSLYILEFWDLSITLNIVNSVIYLPVFHIWCFVLTSKTHSYISILKSWKLNVLLASLLLCRTYSCVITSVSRFKVNFRRHMRKGSTKLSELVLGNSFITTSPFHDKLIVKTILFQVLGANIWGLYHFDCSITSCSSLCLSQVSEVCRYPYFVIHVL